MYENRPRKWILYLVIVLAVTLLVGWSADDIHFTGLTATGTEVAKGVVHGVFHPDTNLLFGTGDSDVPYLLLQTIAIAVLGTIFGAILAIPFAFLASFNILGNERITNSRSITSYIKGNYNFSKEVLSVDDMMSYEMILGLRTSFGVSKDEFFDKYGVTLESKFDYQDLINNKLLIEKDGKLVIPCSKWYVINSILINFLR